MSTNPNLTEEEAVQMFFEFLKEDYIKSLKKMRNNPNLVGNESNVINLEDYRILRREGFKNE